jgi:hypothetical protein
MSFTPISLPIQQILMTNFVTDIATITNANTLLLQAKLEDLINDLEIDIAGLSIGTDNPINYLKAQSVIIQDQSLIYQTGSPSPTIIASLTKNISNESIFQADHIIANIDLSIDGGSVNNLTVNTSSTFDGISTFNAPIAIKSSVIESKESITADLTWDGTLGGPATALVTLTNTSRQNIFITLKASAAPTANAVYDGTNVDSNISEFRLILDFDATSPIEQNTKFTIYIVDVIEASALGSITSAVQLAGIPVKVIGGTNNYTSSAIITHDNANNVGLTNTASFNQYGTNITFDYILDSNGNDRLVVAGLVGASIF